MKTSATLICTSLFISSIVSAAPRVENPLIATARQIIGQRMLDPSSMQTRNMRIVKATVDGSVTSLVCGEYNAKNRMGGYVGFRSFVFDPIVNKAVMTTNGDFFYGNGDNFSLDSLKAGETLESIEAYSAEGHRRLDMVSKYALFCDR